PDRIDLPAHHPGGAVSGPSEPNEPDAPRTPVRKVEPMSADKTTPASTQNLSVEDLVRLVSASVMAALQTQPQNSQIPDNLGAVIGDAVAAGMTRNQRRKVTIGEYIARLNEGRPEMLRR